MIFKISINSVPVKLWTSWKKRQGLYYSFLSIAKIDYLICGNSRDGEYILSG